MASIKERKNNSYLLIAYNGYHPNGKQNSITQIWHAPEGMTKSKAKAEALRLAAEMEEDFRKNSKCTAFSTIEVLCNFYFETSIANNTLTPKTHDRYVDISTRVIEYFEDKKLCDIDAQEINHFYMWLKKININTKVKCKINFKNYIKNQKKTKDQFAQEAGISPSVLTSIFHDRNIERKSAEKIVCSINQPFDDFFESSGDIKHLSNSTIGHYHEFLSSIFTFAVENDIIRSNPCRNTKKPHHNNPEHIIPDINEIDSIFEKLKIEPIKYRAFVIISIFTGMRRGEVVGLKWENVDLDRRLIHVREARVYSQSKGVYTSTTKNKKSRNLKMSDVLYDLFMEIKEYQLKQKELMMNLWEDTGYVITNELGQPIHPDSIGKWYRNFNKKNGFTENNVHALRHFCASVMIQKTKDPRPVSQLLGHADYHTTEKIYIHELENVGYNAHDTIDIDDIVNIVNKSQ